MLLILLFMLCFFDKYVIFVVVFVKKCFIKIFVVERGVELLNLVIY